MHQATPSPRSDASIAPDLRLRRRSALKVLAGLGLGTVTFQRALAAQVAENGTITVEMIGQAEWISGLELTDDERDELAKGVKRSLQGYLALRQIAMDNSVPPAIYFHVLPQGAAEMHPVHHVELVERSAPERPSNADDLAFLPVSELASLVRTRQVSCVELTQLYLDRLHRFDPLLKCVVTFADDLALRQAQAADREIAAGRYRGPLHGIPWGAKDLIAYPPMATTWGAAQFKDQVTETKATVARRLDDAGAVLAAKLSLGALAWGDEWFGGKTRNPWQPTKGSSGSSAGSASATSAGLVGFALGSETLGSIVSPCRRCGTTGLRPTFGRVSRHGCMALAWSMDKIGPIARSVEDCALVFGAILGADGHDPTAISRSFQWPCRTSITKMRVGFFENPRAESEPAELAVLKDLGVELVPIKLPAEPPARAISVVLNTEAATVFDDLIRTRNLEGLNRWPNAWRQGQFVPAVEYLRANRARTLLMREMEKLFEKVDAYVGGNDLVITNLTGHPCVVLPNGFVERDELVVPRSLTFTGRPFGESQLLALADAYQKATDFHLPRPPVNEFLKAQEEERQKADTGHSENTDKG